MGTMRIIDESGDTTVVWEEANAASLTKAEAVFNRLRDQRHLAFARPRGAPAGDAERIYAFDPEADEIVWVRPIAGG
jgi:hypothetical protein